MGYKVIIKDEARIDIVTNWEYYQNLAEGLGDIFEAAVFARLSDLSLHPLNYGFLGIDNRKIYRSVLLKKFPYKIVYEVIATEVVVFEIFHTKRHPSRIFKRLQGK